MVPVRPLPTASDRERRPRLRTATARLAAVAAAVLALIGFLTVGLMRADRAVGRLTDARAALLTIERKGLTLESETWRLMALRAEQGATLDVGIDGLALAGDIRRFALDRMNSGTAEERAVASRALSTIDQWVESARAAGPGVDNATAVAVQISKRLHDVTDEGLALNDRYLASAKARRTAWTAVLAATLIAALGAGLALLAGSRRRLSRAREEAFTALQLHAAELEALASTDPLTGLPNQRSFHARLAREVADAPGAPLSLVLVDVDHFKAVNDRFGHLAGDAVLAAVGRALSGNVRDGDLVARIGGEEFGWIMPGATVIEAVDAAERARRTISSSPAGPQRVTASFGVATLRPGEDVLTLYSRADAELYRAKGAGRDIVLAAPESGAGAPRPVEAPGALTKS